MAIISAGCRWSGDSRSTGMLIRQITHANYRQNGGSYCKNSEREVLACGIDLSSNPKIRRNLGESSKGHCTDVRVRVCGLWIDLASKMTNTAVLIHDNTKMCRTCFNNYDKYTLKFEELEKSLEMLC